MPRLVRPKSQEEELVGDYPEIVHYFSLKYDSGSRQSIMSFIKNCYPEHQAFLRKRGWPEEKIDDLWSGIVRGLMTKRIRVIRMEKARMNIVRKADGHGNIKHVDGWGFSKPSLPK
jgi:hypothetical protein